VKRRGHTPVHIIRKLWEAERMLGEGKTGEIPDRMKSMLTQVADGVWVRQSEWVWTNSTVVRGEDGLVDPGIDGCEVNHRADDLGPFGIPVVAGFSTLRHPHRRQCCHVADGSFRLDGSGPSQPVPLSGRSLRAQPIERHGASASITGPPARRSASSFSAREPGVVVPARTRRQPSGCGRGAGSVVVQPRRRNFFLAGGMG
jgi:hypothetical protein